MREIEARIAQHTRAAVTGALDRSSRTSNPKLRDIDWDRTIRANLAHYLPEHRTVVPEKLVGYGRRSQAVKRDVVLAVDQSGSMASSVVYASVFAAVLASMRALRTSLVVFDTAVVDLTDKLADPVDVLFGTQLGGGTDINRAIAYSRSLITRPADSLFVLISDLYEGGIRARCSRASRRCSPRVCRSWCCWLCPTTGRRPSTATTRRHSPNSEFLPSRARPDRFPELLAVALERGDVGRWSQSF